MKLRNLLLLAAAIACAASLRADTMAGDKVKIKGSIILETGPGGTTVTKPINPSTILALLAVSNPPLAKDLQYYLDTTTDSFVIAPKGIAASGTATPLATVYSIAGATVNWQAIPTHSYNGGNNVLLDGTLAGSHWFLSSVSKKNVETDVRRFIAYGAVSGTNTVMQGTITDTYKAIP